MLPAFPPPLCLALALACVPAAQHPDGAPSAPPEAAGSTFRGPGPRFAARRLRSLPARPEHLLSGDLDGDGQADLLVVPQGEGPLLFWPGGARGLAAEPRELAAHGWALRPVLVPGPVSTGGAAGVAVGRVAIASRAERTLALHDLAAGTSAVVWRGEPGQGVPRALAVGDLEGDGELDLALVTDRPELVIVGGGRSERVPLDARLPRCALVLADGAGVAIGFQDTLAVEVLTRSGPRASLELGFIPRDLAELDLDGDGDLELAVLGGDQTLRVFGLGRPGGAEAWLDPAGRAPRDLATAAVPLAATTADLDGDGRPELLVISAYGLRYEVFGPGPDGPARRAAGYAGQTPRGLACGDFDGDARIDLALANQGARSMGLLFGDGRGAFHDAEQLPVGATPNSLVAADLDGDGRPELGVLCAKDLTLSILAQENGALRRVQTASTGDSPRALTAVDWDGDGRAELAWLAKDSRAWITVASFSGGTARTLVELVPGRGGADLLALVLDGRAALLVADEVAGELVCLRPAGEATRLPWPAATPLALCALQLDGDPEPELAVALGAGPRRGVALVDLVRGADGVRRPVEIGFVPTAGWPLDVAAVQLAPGAVGLAALTKDDPRLPQGALELLIADQHGGYRALEAVPAGANPQHLEVGDVDGDGRDELFVAAQNDHRVHAFRLRVEPGAALPAGLEALDGLGAHLGCLDLVLADVDGDGGLDLLVANGFSDDVSLLRLQPPP